MKMQFNFKSLLSLMALVLTVALPLTGCNDDDDHPVSASEALANESANSEPGSLDDAAGMKAGIENLFGGPDSEPVDVSDGESIKGVFSKAGS